MNPKQKVKQKSKEENVDETASECVAAELMSVPQQSPRHNQQMALMPTACLS